MAAATNLSRVIFKLSSRELSSEVTLTPATWRVLVQFDGARSVAEIAKALGTDESEVAKLADGFLRSGILQVAPGSAAPPNAAVNGAFLDQVTNELARAMGPLAALTLEDEIAALGETREHFPSDRIPELVEQLSRAIRDEVRRHRFQVVMGESIRKL
ncbi:MAG TPA: hypothetical protein VLH58_01350 [Candidatus Methylomirabilis sp.]|nr:hypothetical protein [Candidatus Methylomirabilis sp.]HSC69966.1 hypothetical protein [Candidatus Methylomirabilis sp.]